MLGAQVVQMLSRYMLRLTWGSALAASVLMGPAQAQSKSVTVDTIKQRGNLKCGVYENSPGLAALNDKGNGSDSTSTTAARSRQRS